MENPQQPLFGDDEIAIDEMEVSNVFSYCPIHVRCVIIDTQRGCALDKGFSAPSIEYVFVGLKMSLQGKNRHPHCLSPIVR